VSDAEIDRLERAIDRARAEGDMRTTHRLIEIMEEVAGPLLGPFGDLDALPDIPSGTGDLIANLIEAIGLDAFLNIIRLPPEARQGLKEVERQVGREALIDMLRASLDSSLLDMPDLPPLPFGPPVRKPRAGSGKNKPRRTEDDDDFLDQLDLF
jgi:hypothetical protein